MGLSAFLARDVIQYILPTIIALGLFFPIFDQNITADYIVFGGALIGYFISSFVGYFAGWLLVLPYVRRRRKTLDAAHDWWSRNFDYDKLWHSLNRDEKEYLYGTQSYYEFYRLVSLYLMIYMAVNMVLVVNAVIACPIAWNDPSSSDMRLAWIAISAARTTMFWKGTAPSAALVLFAFFCFLFNIRDMLLEYGIVFQQYVTLGRLYQRKNGGIATSVWGRLLLEGSGRPVLAHSYISQI